MINERLNRFWKAIVVTSTLVGIFLSINRLFYLDLFGFVPIENSYLYYLLATFMPIAFLIFPANKKSPTPIRWYDAVLFGISLVIIIYFGLNGERIILEGWDWHAPVIATIFSILLWLFLLEALRRTGGLILSLLCFAFSLYPLIASEVPIEFLQGQSFDILTTARNHIMSTNSVLGIPFTAVGNLIIGFLVFGIVLTFTGGGEFFFRLAQSMFGKTRGGEAKVSIIGSAFFGMLSGSAISNTITTGSMTIPAMKKTGYKSEYAAAIEACSSTGGTFTPPIMGTAAFIMASFLGVPYYEIVLAAAVPAVLYYVALMVQTDGFAAKNNLKGLAASEVPSFKDTLKGGWYYILAFFLLIYFLAALNSEAQAPYYASAVLLIIAMFKKETRLQLKQFIDMFANMSKVLSEIVCIIAGVGFIVGAFTVTGISFSFSRELIAAAGDSLVLILIAGAITCFILGMGMTVSAVYVFLAVIMAPAIVEMGVDPIAAHLFVIYWASASYITPPVALAAFAASGIANTSPMKTSVVAVRLGVVTFFIPFFFAYDPALLGRGGDALEIILSIATALIGVFVISSALEGYVIGIGRIRNFFLRTLLVVAGICIIAPNMLVKISAAVFTILIYLLSINSKRIREHSSEVSHNELNG